MLSCSDLLLQRIKQPRITFLPDNIIAVPFSLLTSCLDAALCILLSVFHHVSSRPTRPRARLGIPTTQTRIIAIA